MAPPERDYVPIGTCERCCASINVCSLQVFNLIDFAVGIVLVAFGLYLEVKLGTNFMNIHTAWLCWSCLILGILLLTVSMLSFCAISSTSCRCCSIPSGYLGILVAIVSLVLGSVSVALKSKMFEYFDNSGSATGLTTNEITLIENFYQFIAYGFFGLCVIQLLRFRASISFRENALRLDGEYDALVDQDDRNWSQKFSANSAARKEKYDDLRQHYKNKYSIKGSLEDGKDESDRDSQF